MGVGQNCFAGGQFWYYYNKIIPSPTPDKKVEVWQLDLKQQIESNQVIAVVILTETCQIMANTFIEDAYELYTNPKKAYYARVEKNKGIKKDLKNKSEKSLYY